MRILVLAFLGGFALAAHADYIKPLATVPLVGPGTTGQKLQNGMTVGADVGAGPHKGRSFAPAPRESVDEIPAADHPTGNRQNDNSGSASTGSSRSGDASIGSSGADNDAIERDEDRANKNKEKFKHRPGYKEDVPLPRASK